MWTNKWLLPVILPLIIICSISLVFTANFPAVAQTQPSSTLSVKFLKPENNASVPVGRLVVHGSSSDNSTNDCDVLVDLNGIKPYQPAVAAGPGGKSDFSLWNFTYTSAYSTIKPGHNDLTAKILCKDNPQKVKFTSINLTGIAVGGINNPQNNTNVQSNETTVQNNATNALDNKTAVSNQLAQNDTNLTVNNNNVTDIEPPQIQVPNQTLIVNAQNSTGSKANYNVNVTDNNDPNPLLTCDPPSGTFLPLGHSMVVCSASDNSGNVADGTFDVLVKSPPAINGTLSIVEMGNANTTQQNASSDNLTSQNTSECTKLDIPDISAIGDDGDDSVPENVLDGDLDTRWSHKGEDSWIQAGLSETHEICSVDIAWYKGDNRKYDYDLLASEDGDNFDKVFSGESSGDTESLEHVDFPNTKAKFLRVEVHGNDESDKDESEWASITELQINGRQNEPVKSNLEHISTNVVLNVSGQYSYVAESGNMTIPLSAIVANISLSNSSNPSVEKQYDLIPVEFSVENSSRVIKIITKRTDAPLDIVIGMISFDVPVDFSKPGQYNGMTSKDWANVLIAHLNGKTFDSAVKSAQLTIK